ncbi:MAG: MFS transporter, partial [Ruminiclostridium sp.]
IITLSFSILWVLKMRNHPSEVGLEAPNPVNVNSKEKAAENTEAPSLVKIIVESQLYLVAIACIAQGVIKDGITLWTPSFLQDSFQLGQQSVAVFSLIVPLVSILGIVLAGWLNKLFKENEKVPIMFLLFFTSLFCILLFYFSGKNMYIDILLLSLSSALMYGANTLLLTIIPLKFFGYNKVSGIAGFLDFCSYLGAGFSGFLTGSIVDGAGWKYMMLLWAILAILGIGSMALLHTCKRAKTLGESPAQLIISACKKNKNNV